MHPELQPIKQRTFFDPPEPPKTLRQPSLEKARTARDEGLQRVESVNQRWSRRCLEIIANRPVKLDEFSGEDLRLALIPIAGTPSNVNAWGALIMAAVRCGLIVHTGRYASPKSRASHACKKAVYRWPDDRGAA